MILGGNCWPGWKSCRGLFVRLLLWRRRRRRRLYWWRRGSCHSGAADLRRFIVGNISRFHGTLPLKHISPFPSGLVGPLSLCVDLEAQCYCSMGITRPEWVGGGGGRSPRDPPHMCVPHHPSAIVPKLALLTLCKSAPMTTCVWCKSREHCHLLHCEMSFQLSSRVLCSVHWGGWTLTLRTLVHLEICPSVWIRANDSITNDLFSHSVVSWK